MPFVATRSVICAGGVASTMGPRVVRRVVAPFLLWLVFMPAIDNLGQVLVIVLLAELFVVHSEVLRRRQTAEPRRRPSILPHGQGPAGR